VTFPDQVQSASVPRRNWPESFPRKDQIVELSNLTTENAESNLVLISGLLSFVHATCISGQRPYVLCASEPFSDKLFLKLGMHFRREPEFEDPVFLGHPIDSVSGTGANPFLWNFVWGTAAKYLIESKTVTPTGVTRIMLKVYQFFNPLRGAYLKIIAMTSR
jgi:hypothetical protein